MMVCGNCENEAVVEHHIIPKIYGGTEKPTNKVMLCERCHAIYHEALGVGLRGLTLKAMAKRKADKSIYSPCPFGYDRQGNKMVENKHEQRMIEMIKGLRRDGWTLQMIADTLTDQNVKTKRGGKWYAGTIKYILGNNLYGG